MEDCQVHLDGRFDCVVSFDLKISFAGTPQEVELLKLYSIE
jgi:hypothetical protein